jgi:hypothetical protein
VQQQCLDNNTQLHQHRIYTQTEGDKKFLSREEEPEEYWSSKGERAGSNPLSVRGVVVLGVVVCLCV